MKLSFSFALWSAIIASSRCHAEERDLLDTPGFGEEGYATYSVQDQDTNVDEDEWDHVPFQSRIVGGTVASGSDYPFHVNLGGCGGTL